FLRFFDKADQVAIGRQHDVIPELAAFALDHGGAFDDADVGDFAQRNLKARTACGGMFGRGFMQSFRAGRQVNAPDPALLTAVSAASMSLQVLSMVSKSGPKTFTPMGVRTPVESMSMRLAIG